MRIVHVIEYFQPKLGYQETFLAQAQLQAGHEVKVITGDRFRPFERYDELFGQMLGPRVRSVGPGLEEGIPVVRLPVRWESSERAWLVGLESAILRERADVVHVHGLGNPAALRLGVALRWVPSGLIFDEHMLEVVVRRTLAGKLYYSTLPRVLRLSIPPHAGLVAVSDETREYMVSRLGLRRERIEVIPLGADDTAFAPDEPLRAAVRRDLGVAPDERLIVYTGKIVKTKGPDVLVSAITHLEAQDRTKVLLVGAGSGAYVDSLRERARADGWGDRLEIRGPVPSKELRGFYNAADVCVWPRQASTSAFDAAACGKPIIIADEPVGRERVAAGNGLTCREGDPVDLARALTFFLAEPGRALEAGLAGRRMIEQRYSWRALSERFVDVYRRSAERAARRTASSA